MPCPPGRLRLYSAGISLETDAFSAVAAASPSVWFPGFSEYMKERIPQVRSVYLSLGDREEKARNPVLASVGEQIRDAHDMLTRQGVKTTLEWNSGNHFKEVDSEQRRHSPGQ